MNPNLIILAGSDFQLLDLLLQKIKTAYPQKEVYVTHDAFDVYAKVWDWMPELAILEMVFPQWDWDGYILFKFLKKNLRFREMKSILIMDTLDESSQQIAKDRDIDKVLFKIYNLDFIFDEIKKFI